MYFKTIDANSQRWFNEKNMLTQNDLDKIEVVVEKKVDEKTKNLPTKDEFYEQTLKVLKKLDNLEESMDIVSSRQSKHSDQIEALEKIHPQGIHSVVV